MHTGLDVFTLLISIAAASLTMALALFATHTPRREGLGLWALGLVLHALCYVLFALRGVVADGASVWLANTLLSASLALVLGAVAQFHARPLPWPAMAIPVLLTALGFALWLHDARTRVVLAGLVLGLQLVLAAWALWHPTRPSQPRGALLLSLGLGLQAALLLSRAFSVLHQGLADGAALQPGGMQAAVFLLVFIVVILTSLGFILMTKDRADAENLLLATQDALTGVANRRALIDALGRDLAHAVRQHQAYALLLLDVDHFKGVNDTYGHLAGDAVLRHVAQLLHARVRTQDLVGRYGGEEFLVLLPGTSAQGAQHLAEQMREHVALTPCLWQGQALTVTLSIGVCTCACCTESDQGILIEAADRALYRAKQGGRNRVESNAYSAQAPR